MNYEISAKARTDLINIWEYTFENWSLVQADKYYEILLKEIESISKNPNTGRSYSHLRKTIGGVVSNRTLYFTGIKTVTKSK